MISRFRPKCSVGRQNKYRKCNMELVWDSLWTCSGVSFFCFLCLLYHKCSQKDSVNDNLQVWQLFFSKTVNPEKIMQCSVMGLALGKHGFFIEFSRSIEHPFSVFLPSSFQAWSWDYIPHSKRGEGDWKRPHMDSYSKHSWRSRQGIIRSRWVSYWTSG